MELFQQNDKILLLADSSFDIKSSEFNEDVLKEKFNASLTFNSTEQLNLGKFHHIMIFNENAIQKKKK